MPRKRHTLHDHADLLMGGELDAELLRLRFDEECTFDQIARELENRGVHITRETVRQWLLDLSPTSPEAA